MTDDNPTGNLYAPHPAYGRDGKRWACRHGNTGWAVSYLGYRPYRTACLRCALAVPAVIVRGLLSRWREDDR